MRFALRHSLFRNFRTSSASLSGRKGSSKIVVVGPSGRTDGPEGEYAIYRNIFLLCSLPLIVALTVKMFAFPEETERPEFRKYEYMRRRTKRFPWGDGEKSLFHNPRMNALPDGYEDGSERSTAAEEEEEDDD